MASISHGRRAIVHLSFIMLVQSSLVNEMVAQLTDAGVVVVASAGYFARDACQYAPAGAPSALTVGSLNNTDGLSSFTNFGACVDLWAPGSHAVGASGESDTGLVYVVGRAWASPVYPISSIVFSTRVCPPCVYACVRVRL